MTDSATLATPDASDEDMRVLLPGGNNVARHIRCAEQYSVHDRPQLLRYINRYTQEHCLQREAKREIKGKAMEDYPRYAI